MNQRRTTNRTGGDVIRAIGNLTWTTFIVIGSPIALARVFGYPLPRQMPDWAEVITTPMQLVEPSVIINALVCVGWLVWGIVAAYVLVDLVDLARGVGNRARRLGPASVIAGKLVASIALLLSLLRTEPSAASAASRPAVAVQVVDMPSRTATTPLNVTLVSSSRLNLPSEAAPAVPAAQQATRNYVVQRGDSLWRIAEQQLGDGFRWREIYELNKAAIANPDLICTGWSLSLPADAAQAVATSTPATADANSAPTETVPVASIPDTPPPAVPNAPTTSVAATPTTERPTEPQTAPTTPAAPADTAEAPAPIPTPTEPGTAVQPVTSEPTPSTISPAATTTEAPSAMGAPLWLRSLGFTSRAEYDAWIAARPDARDGPTETPDQTTEGSPSVALSTVAASTLAAGILAASVVRSLERRRRRVLNRRPIGAALPPRDPRLRKTEQTVRINAHPEPLRLIECIDAVLRLLTSTLGPTGMTPVLLLIRATPDGIELLWSAKPTIEPPAGFVTEDESTSWVYAYPDSEALDELRHQMIGVAYYAEALVTLGDTADGPVLINLAALETLDTLGDSDSVEAWIAAAQLELEAHSWATKVETCLPARSATGQARVSAAIYIDDAGSAHPYIQFGDPDDAPREWRLEIGARQAQLHNVAGAFALDITPVGIDPDVGRLGTQLLLHADFNPYDEGGSPTDLPPSPVPPANPADDETPVEDMPVEGGSVDVRLPASGDPDAEPAHEGRLIGTLVLAAPAEPERETVLDVSETADEANHDSTDTLHVRLLGRPKVSGWLTPPKGNRPEEIVVYLAAARPGGVHRDRLIDALWDGERVKPKALYNHLVAIRRHAGNPDIIANENSTYRLADCVHSDWDQFCTLADRAGALEGRARLDCLRDALSLIDGKPFDVAETAYAWVAGEGVVSHIEVTVTDLASILATEAIEARDTELAIFAARKGLLACPWLLRMYGYIIEAHTLDGNASLAEHAWREAIRVAGEDDLPDEVVNTYEAGRSARST
jgi:hypothetical protein